MQLAKNMYTDTFEHTQYYDKMVSLQTVTETNANDHMTNNLRVLAGISAVQTTFIDHLHPVLHFWLEYVIKSDKKRPMSEMSSILTCFK